MFLHIKLEKTHNEQNTRSEQKKAVEAGSTGRAAAHPRPFISKSCDCRCFCHLRFLTCVSINWLVLILEKSVILLFSIVNKTWNALMEFVTKASATCYWLLEHKAGPVNKQTHLFTVQFQTHDGNASTHFKECFVLFTLFSNIFLRNPKWHSENAQFVN